MSAQKPTCASVLPGIGLRVTMHGGYEFPHCSWVADCQARSSCFWKRFHRLEEVQAAVEDAREETQRDLFKEGK